MLSFTLKHTTIVTLIILRVSSYSIQMFTNTSNWTEDLASWTITQYSASSSFCKESYCGEQHMVGGYKCFQAGDMMEQTFDIPDDQQGQFNWGFDLWYLNDANSNLYTNTKVDNSYTNIRISFSNPAPQDCSDAQKNYLEQYSQSIEVSSNQVKLRIRLDGSKSATSYWGVSNFYLDNCYKNQGSTSQNCSQCYGPDANQCLQCSNSEHYIFENSCLAECPTGFGVYDDGQKRICSKCIEGYYLDNKNCMPCSSKCDTCFGPSEYNCITCSENYPYNLDKQCYNKCPETFYADDTIPKKCTNCQYPCNQCETRELCSSCFYPYQLNGTKCTLDKHDEDLKKQQWNEYIKEINYTFNKFEEELKKQQDEEKKEMKWVKIIFILMIITIGCLIFLLVLCFKKQRHIVSSEQLPFIELHEVKKKNNEDTSYYCNGGKWADK